MKITLVVFGTWLLIYVVLLIVTTLTPDAKFTTRKSRFEFSTLTLWAWPILLVMAPIYSVNQWAEKKFGLDLRWEKKKVILWRLMGSHPDWMRSHDTRATIDKFIFEYLVKYNLKEGIKMIKDKSVSREVFEDWCNENVTIPVHSYGLWKKGV